MKNLLSFTCGFAILLTVFSCKKSNEESPISGKLEGTWELRQSYSMAGKLNYAAGNGTTLTFKGDTFEMYQSASKVNSGGFQIKEDGNVAQEVGLTIPDGVFPQYLSFSGLSAPDRYPSDSKIYFRTTKDSLYTIEGFFPSDGGSASSYVKIQ